MQERVWRPDWPCSVLGTLRQHRRGGGDPTFRIDDDGTVWRGVRTPEGRRRWPCGRGRGRATCSRRPGARAPPGCSSRSPRMLGADDDWSGFEPRHPVLEELRRRHPHARLGRTGLVMEALVPAIIEQKVTGKEAFGGFRIAGAPVRRAGARTRSRAQGLGAAGARSGCARSRPGSGCGCTSTRPAPATVVTAAKVADSLERTASLPYDEADRRLRSLPGRRGVDERRGAPAGPRRPGRRVVR